MTGCTQVSAGCDNCYAMRIAERFRGGKAWPDGFDLTLRPHRLDELLRWREPARIFVNSMSDLFHRDIPDDHLRQVWDVMLRADHHTYQVLTKRAHRMAHKIWTLSLPLPPHIWLGVSAENQQMADSRIPSLLEPPAAVRWVSAEPLLGQIDLGRYIDRLQWLVVSGESGPGRRSMDYQWAQRPSRPVRGWRRGVLLQTRQRAQARRGRSARRAGLPADARCTTYPTMG